MIMEGRNTDDEDSLAVTLLQSAIDAEQLPSGETGKRERSCFLEADPRRFLDQGGGVHDGIFGERARPGLHPVLSMIDVSSSPCHHHQEITDT